MVLLQVARGCTGTLKGHLKWQDDEVLVGQGLVHRLRWCVKMLSSDSKRARQLKPGAGCGTAEGGESKQGTHPWLQEEQLILTSRSKYVKLLRGAVAPAEGCA